MFESLGSLFSTEKSSLDEGDIKHLIQGYIQERTGLDQVYCQTVRGGNVVIRVGSAALDQEVRVLDRDIKRVAKEKGGYTINQISITTG